MSKTRFVTYVCWVVSAVSIVGLAAWFIFGNGLFFGGDWFEFGDFGYENRHVVSADDVEDLTIDWTSGSVSVGVHDGDEIIITEFSRRELRDRDKLSYDILGGTLTIAFTEGRSRMNPPTKRLEVLIPETRIWHEMYLDDDVQNLQILNITTVSGRVNVADVRADEVTVRTTSGRIEAEDIISSTMNLRTTSGRIEVFGASSQDVSLQTVSGRIEVHYSHIYSINTQTTSGRHEISGAFFEIEARTTSGRIEITCSVVPESIAARTTSGRIEVTVPHPGEAIAVDYSITSGRFSSEIPIITHGVGNNARFSLTTTSGRISIFEYMGDAAEVPPHSLPINLTE